ncbi:MAG: hypothetical protein JXA10_02065 [Anaerolineae bacterium]|nr:hypothetical protein [Anaerolineae bacterium]
MTSFMMPLTAIQPSQLYISAAKLAQIESWFDPAHLADYDPLPVKRLAERVVFTDGHTRALAALRAGLAAVRVAWDEDDLDWDAYAICVAWCLADGITTTADLAGRIVTAGEYEVVWLDRCRVMQAELHDHP